MKTIEEIAQWVIDNRYPKSENDKVSDFEMYQTLIEVMNQALRQPLVSGSIPSEAELVSETADAYCPNCEAYIVNERVTFDECCDKCGEEIEWHE